MKIQADIDRPSASGMRNQHGEVDAFHEVEGERGLDRGRRLRQEVDISHVRNCYNPTDGLVYVGLTALDRDIFYTFDPRTHTWESLNYPGERDRYGSKIHQGLEVDDQGRVYAGVATLGDADIWPKAAGGPIFRYDPRTSGEYEFLCIPIEHDYVQGFVMDRSRGIIYGDTFPGSERCSDTISEATARAC